MRPFLKPHGQKSDEHMAKIAICLVALYMSWTYVLIKHMADLIEGHIACAIWPQKTYVKLQTYVFETYGFISCTIRKPMFYETYVHAKQKSLAFKSLYCTVCGNNFIIIHLLSCMTLSLKM